MHFTSSLAPFLSLCHGGRSRPHYLPPPCGRANRVPFVSAFATSPSSPPTTPGRRRRVRGRAAAASLVLGAAATATARDGAGLENDRPDPRDDAEPPPVPLPPYLPPPPPPPLPKVQLLRRRLVHDPESPGPYDEIPDGSHEEWEFFFGLYEKFAEEVAREGRDDGDAAGGRDGRREPGRGRPPALEEPSPGPLAHQSPLRNWIADQRKSYMKTVGVLDLGARRSNWGTPYLLRSHKERLDGVGFAWGHIERRDLTDAELYSEEFRREVETKYKDWIWTPIYERLKLHADECGHTRLPLREASGLGTWTAYQRAARLRMPRRRRLKLDSIGFDWDYRDPSEGGEWLEELFRGGGRRGRDAGDAAAGDPDRGDVAADLPIPVEEVVARSAVPSRWRWTQRPGGDRARPADAAAASRPKPVPWSRRLEDLEAYGRRYGNVEVPMDYDEPGLVTNPGLGKWLARTKRRCRKLSWKSRLALERIGVTLDYS